MNNNRNKDSTKIRRYCRHELFSNPAITSLKELKSKKKSQLNYKGQFNCSNGLNFFVISNDGQKTLGMVNNFIYIENWKKSLNSCARVMKLVHSMTRAICMINGDIDKNFVVMGDYQGFIMIQRISDGKLLFKNMNIFPNDCLNIVSSSVHNNFLCVGNIEYKVKTVDLKRFSLREDLSYKYKSAYILSLRIISKNDESFVIATGKSSYIFFVIKTDFSNSNFMINNIIFNRM